MIPDDLVQFHLTEAHLNGLIQHLHVQSSFNLQQRYIRYIINENKQTDVRLTWFAGISKEVATPMPND
jgi:hypothetical protein